MYSPKLLYFALPTVLAIGSCNMPSAPERPEVHGHRGCRGLLPENTVAAFQKAAELGCDRLELDVVITGDGEVLVSHEPWMEHRICLTEEGASLTEAEGRAANIYRMPLNEIQSYDCGSKQHPDFPEQVNAEDHKPTLSEVVEAVENAGMMNGWGVQSYNIEIKSEPELYDVMQPRPEPFAEKVLADIDELGITDRCIIQSFDPAVLEAVHGIDETIATALLVDNTEGVEANLKRLTFTPTYYSAEFPLMDAQAVALLRGQGIEPLVWTVNEESDMRAMIALGLNGIITDYPDRLIRILDESE